MVPGIPRNPFVDTQEWCELLSTKNIFLFKESRATSHESCNYSIVESIKDGTAVSSKYNNDVMRFTIQNVVVVFSNHIPITRELEDILDCKC